MRMLETNYHMRRETIFYYYWCVCNCQKYFVCKKIFSWDNYIYHETFNYFQEVQTKQNNQKNELDSRNISCHFGWNIVHICQHCLELFEECYRYSATVFSLSGRICSPLRSSLSSDMVNRLVCLNICLTITDHYEYESAQAATTVSSKWFVST